MSAGADDPGDPDLPDGRSSVNEVDDIPSIVTVDAAVPPAVADGAGLGLRPEGCHAFFEQNFCGFFYPEKLAIYKILSYHSNCDLKMTALEQATIIRA